MSDLCINRECPRYTVIASMLCGICRRDEKITALESRVSELERDSEALKRVVNEMERSLMVFDGTGDRKLAKFARDILALASKVQP